MKDKFEMERAAVVVTYKCNLRCKLCATYAPYYKETPLFSYDYIKIVIDKFFKIVTHVNKFVITGGEPLLHNEISKIVEYILQYKNEIGLIEIITNGTIVPNNQLVEVIKKYSQKVSFLVDDYGDISKNVKEVDFLLKNIGANYRVRKYYGNDTYYGGWVNFLDLTKKHNSIDEMEIKYSKCAYPQKLNSCFTIRKNGEMHSCPVSHRCMELGYIEKNSEEYVDLFDNLSIQEQRNKINRIISAKSLSACAFCNGLCEDSERFTPAEQLQW